MYNVEKIGGFGGGGVVDSYTYHKCYKAAELGIAGTVALCKLRLNFKICDFCECDIDRKAKKRKREREKGGSCQI